MANTNTVVFIFCVVFGLGSDTMLNQPTLDFIFITGSVVLGLARLQVVQPRGFPIAYHGARRYTYNNE